MNYIVETEQPIRLDVWLSQKLGQSRSQIQKLIKSGVVLVNGKVRTPHMEVRDGDEVQVSEGAGEQVDRGASKKVIRGSGDQGNNIVDERKKEIASSKTPRNDIRIIFECPDYIIVEKPEGVVVHHDAKHTSGTLVDWILEKYPEIKTVGDPERPGVVHRLDKEVSGLLVIARTREFYEYIRKLFDEREMTKEYLALVFGKVVNRVGTIEFKIVRSKIREKYIGLPSTSDDLDAKTAVTQYEVIAANHHYSLLKLFPETGRTHQLRVHMRTFGHPIAGDKLYSLPKFRYFGQKFSRVFLHARSISFKNFQGEQVSYTSEIPLVMGRVVDDIFHINL